MNKVRHETDAGRNQDRSLEQQQAERERTRDKGSQSDPQRRQGGERIDQQRGEDGQRRQQGGFQTAEQADLQRRSPPSERDRDYDPDGDRTPPV